MENNWVRFVVIPSSAFFPIFQQVIKQIGPEKESVIVKVVNRERSEKLKKEYKDQFKFVFDWQDKDICGIEVFKFTGEA